MMDLSKMSRDDMADLKNSYGTMDAYNTFGVEKVCVDGIEVKDCVACNLKKGWAIYNPKGIYNLIPTPELIKEGEISIHFKSGDIWKKTA